MNKRIAKTTVMLALAAFSTAASAQSTLDSEPPGRVGRVSLAQGKVSISGGVGDSLTDALVNWPVTTRNLITTEPGARTEVRIGSTAIRIDGDSSLEVIELDDDSLRLRLHYGSASIRILSADVLPEFELSTPQGRVRMLKPGRLRVDAERVRDTSVVSVFDGEARVDGGGASLTIRAGRSAELRDEDVRTLQAQRDGFDDWALARDRSSDGSRSARYLSTEMTGYEELDRHGIWREDTEYGPLWIPQVSAGWVPYRDGRWTWVAPWGWTWVDNAPWGYAPFHYGRWVHVNQRWAWAPGRREHLGPRPIWSPGLVGWVGGSSWYPLSPHDRFVPRYRLSDERLRYLNRWSRIDRDRDGIPDYRERGLTVNPHVNYGHGDRDRDGIPNRFDRDRDGDGVPNRVDTNPNGWRDRDGDGIRDRFDGIRNRVDSRPGVIRERIDGPRDRDRDGDGIRDRFDNDRDGDGIPNRADRQGRDRAPLLTTEPAPAVVQQPARLQRWRDDNEGAGRPERWDRTHRIERSEAFQGRRERPQPMPQPMAQPMPQPMVPSMAPSPTPPRMMAPPQAVAPPPARVMAPAAAPPASQPARARFESRRETLDNNRPNEHLR